MNERGALLIGLIITITIIALAGAAIVSLTTISTFGEIFANLHSRAYYLAESGGRYAIPRIIADPAQAETDLDGRTFTFDSGERFILSVDNTTPGITLLESEGVSRAGDWLEARAKVKYRIPRSFIFKYAAFSNTGRLTVNNSAYIDSYDSSSGPWSSRGAIRNGHVGTNRTGASSVRLLISSAVYGNATVGVGGNPATNISVAVGALLTGTRGALLTAVDMTPMAMPTGGGTAVDLILTGSSTYTFTEGSYRLNRLTVQNNAVLTISGNVTLYVENSIRIINSGRINIQAGGSLTIYAARDMLVNLSARVNETQNPGSLVIFGTSTFNSLIVRDNAVMHAAIYAPA
ncbi:MAG TPA: hypothetical protein VJ373_04895, partial [Desulfatiglandales bacterium]|nr:hypothetical protein [Desulfatiglandales bacterium]